MVHFGLHIKKPDGFLASNESPFQLGDEFGLRENQFILAMKVGQQFFGLIVLPWDFSRPIAMILEGGHHAPVIFASFSHKVGSTGACNE